MFKQPKHTLAIEEILNLIFISNLTSVYNKGCLIITRLWPLGQTGRSEMSAANRNCNHKRNHNHKKHIDDSKYLLSSPPALMTNRSPLVKRMLVTWAEWPRKRLCLAWGKTIVLLTVVLFTRSEMCIVCRMIMRSAIEVWTSEIPCTSDKTIRNTWELD